MLLKSNEPSMVRDQLCGIQLKTLRGTIRSIPDKDDNWYYHLSGQYKKVFDIGCNVGYTALLTTIQKKVERLLLVDPNPEALSWAARNLILNNLGGCVNFMTYFVSDRTGEMIKFYSIGADAAGSMFAGHAESASAINQYYMVPTITIDDLVDQVGWIPELIKLDVEGAESMALIGATELTKKRETIFFVEMHSSKELPIIENTANVLTWCQSTNYSAWYLKEKRILNDAQEAAGYGKYHLLLQPEGFPFPGILQDMEVGASLPDDL